MATLALLDSKGRAVPYSGMALSLGLDRGIAGQVTLAGAAPAYHERLEVQLKNGERVEESWSMRVESLDAPWQGGGTITLRDMVLAPAEPFTLEVFPAHDGASYADLLASRSLPLGHVPESFRERNLDGLVVRQMTTADALDEIARRTDTHWRIAGGKLEFLEFGDDAAKDVDCVGLRRRDDRVLVQVPETKDTNGSKPLPELGARVRLKGAAGREGTVLAWELHASAGGPVVRRLWVGEPVHAPNRRGPTEFTLPGTVTATDPHTVRVDGGRGKEVEILAELMVLEAAGGSLRETLPVRAGDATTVRFQTRGLSTDMPSSRVETPGASSEAYEFHAAEVVERAEKHEWDVTSLQIRTKGMDIDER